MDSLTQIQSIIIFAWWMAFALSVVLYVVLDGADLGAGVFSLFVRNADERGAIMSAMAGTWDANETWLIVAGGVLFATFPFVYGSAFSYLMVPLALALWGMITRAVSLEFRHHGRRPLAAFLRFCLRVLQPGGRLFRRHGVWRGDAGISADA